jgi:hypothetical protein
METKFDYSNDIKEIKIKRLRALVLVLFYIPFGYLVIKASKIFNMDFLGVLIFIYFFYMIIELFIFNYSRCPRCGKYMFYRILSISLFNKCLHCGLQIPYFHKK